MPSTRRTFMAAAATARLVRRGQIGYGGRSRDHLSELVKAGENTAIVAVCDVWVSREQRAADIEKAFGAKPWTHPHILMDIESHMANFLRCVRSRGTPRASVDNGFHHAVAGCMATVSLETGRRAAFDPDRLEIV